MPGRKRKEAALAYMAGLGGRCYGSGLAKAMGISRSLAYWILKELTRLRLVQRCKNPSWKCRVDYRLTSRGRLIAQNPPPERSRFFA